MSTLFIVFVALVCVLVAASCFGVAVRATADPKPRAGLPVMLAFWLAGVAAIVAVVFSGWALVRWAV